MPAKSTTCVPAAAIVPNSPGSLKALPQPLPEGGAEPALSAAERVFRPALEFLHFKLAGSCERCPAPATLPFGSRFRLTSVVSQQFLERCIPNGTNQCVET